MRGSNQTDVLLVIESGLRNTDALFLFCPLLCSAAWDSFTTPWTTHGSLQARILEWGATSSPGDLADPGIKPVSTAPPALSHLGSPFHIYSFWGIGL